jgi:hypothetical protein
MDFKDYIIDLFYRFGHFGQLFGVYSAEVLRVLRAHKQLRVPETVRSLQPKRL